MTMMTFAIVRHLVDSSYATNCQAKDGNLVEDGNYSQPIIAKRKLAKFINRWLWNGKDLLTKEESPTWQHFF